MDSQAIEKVVDSVEDLLRAAQGDFCTGRIKCLCLKLELTPNDIRLGHGTLNLTTGSLLLDQFHKREYISEEDVSYWRSQVATRIQEVYSQSVSSRPQFLDIIVYPRRVSIHERKETQFVNPEKTNKKIRI